MISIFNLKKPSTASRSRVDRGATLTEVIVAIGFFGVIVLVANSLLIDSFKLSARANAQGTIDSLQMSGLHVGRSSRIIFEEIVVNESSDLAKCFKRKGTGCSGLATPGFKPFTAKGLKELNGTFSESGNACAGTTPTDLCPIQRTTKYRIICSTATSCDAVELKVDTTYKKQNDDVESPFVNRTGRVQVPGMALVSREAIDFSCAEANILSGIDYPTLTAICNPFTGLNKSPNQEPLNRFATNPSSSADWQELANSNCSGFGFKDIGLGKSQPVCGSPE
jgi:hypothetical protein